MNRQLDHMVRLIDDLLDVSRISRGMLELKKERTDLASIVETAIETTRPFMDRRNQSIAIEGTAPMFALLDRTRISQVIANLLHNASKYTAVGGEVRLQLAADDGAGIIRVIDPGAGIPRDQIDRVFDMFARIERSVPNSNGGLGIGLALARQLAELHGGSLSADSGGEGCGATFTLSLQLIDASPAVPAPREPTNGAHAGARTPLCIVVIEDNDDAADTLAMWLESMGHQVRVARTGHEGVDLVREACPHLVLCDLGLPGMDGVEVCRRVYALPLPSRPVMVAITGWGMEVDRRRTGEVGFDRHLVKPVAPDALRDILRAVQGGPAGGS
jgi:CheY-like chemotaxis protein/two-component sensor histidine kinase